MKRFSGSSNGFSLIELMVVLAVIGVLLGLLMSAVQAARGAAARTACANNLRQVSLACHNYNTERSSFPPTFAKVIDNRNRGLTWPVLLLPYIEQQNLWSISLAAYESGSWAFENPPHIGLATVVKVFTCAADSRLSVPITDNQGYTAAYGSYWGVFGDGELGLYRAMRENGAMRLDTGVRMEEITDGSSNTLLIGERPPPGRLLSGNWYTVEVPIALQNDPDWAGPGISAMPVYDPIGTTGCPGPIHYGPGRIENKCDSLHFWSLHPGGGHFALCDGSVRFIPYSAVSIMPALATRAGGEVVEVP